MYRRTGNNSGRWAGFANRVVSQVPTAGTWGTQGVEIPRPHAQRSQVQVARPRRSVFLLLPLSRASRRLPKRPPQKPLPPPSLEDWQGIQIALTRALGALGSSPLNNKSAGLHPYGLQIAAQLAGRASVPDPSEVVRRIEAVDEAAISRVVALWSSAPPTLAALGPLSRLEEYEKLRARLTA